MKRNISFYTLIYFSLLMKIFCQTKEKDNVTSCDKINDSKNKFILRTDLSQSELEKILSQNFSSSTHNKNRRRQHKNNNDINENVKEFKSKDNLNKTIYLLEVNSNITELIDENKESNESLYELIDEKNNNDTKIFLSFDKFFTSQYQEMFNYSYTIVIFFLIFAIIVIYYAFILPNEAPDWNINAPVINDNSRKNRMTNINNDYIIKDDDI